MNKRETLEEQKERLLKQLNKEQLNSIKRRVELANKHCLTGERMIIEVKSEIGTNG